jgi:hypothetical protein
MGERHRKLLGIVLVLVAASGTAGCYVATIAGLAESASAGFEEALLGTWESDEDDIELVLTRDEWQSYGVAFRDRAGEQRFTGRLTNIAGMQMFELTLHTGLETSPVLLPVHIVGRLTLKADTLVVELLDYDFFRERIGRASFKLPAVLDDRETVIVTASRTQFRRWLETNAAGAGLFSELATLTRRAN